MDGLDLGFLTARLNTKADNWKNWSEYLREDFFGLPIYFESSLFYQKVSMAVKYEFFLEADDESKLQEYMRQDATK